MAEPVTPWPYMVADVRTEAALSEPVRLSGNGPALGIRVALGPMVSITSMVAKADVLTAVDALRAGTMWSIGGVNFQFAGELEIREAQPNAMTLTARFMRI